MKCLLKLKFSLSLTERKLVACNIGSSIKYCALRATLSHFLNHIKRLRNRLWYLFTASLRVWIQAKDPTTCFSSFRAWAPTERASTSKAIRTPRVTHLGNFVHFVLGVGTTWLPWVPSLISVLHTHWCEIFHTFWALILAIAAAPSLISLFALRIVHHSKLFAVLEWLMLACTTPISFWLHAIIGKVLEFTGTVLSAKEACTCVTFLTLWIAAIKTRFFAFFTLFDRGTFAPAIGSPWARLGSNSSLCFCLGLSLLFLILLLWILLLCLLLLRLALSLELLLLFLLWLSWLGHAGPTGLFCLFMARRVWWWFAVVYFKWSQLWFPVFLLRLLWLLRLWLLLSLRLLLWLLLWWRVWSFCIFFRLRQGEAMVLRLSSSMWCYPLRTFFLWCLKHRRHLRSLFLRLWLRWLLWLLLRLLSCQMFCRWWSLFWTIRSRITWLRWR